MLQLKQGFVKELIRALDPPYIRRVSFIGTCCSLRLPPFFLPFEYHACNLSVHICTLTFDYLIAFKL